MEKLIPFSLYRIVFYDHFIGGSEEVVIQAVGYFYKETKNYLIFSHWVVLSKDGKVVEDNLEPFSLVKKAIVSIEKLKNRGLDN